MNRHFNILKSSLVIATLVSSSLFTETAYAQNVQTSGLDASKMASCIASGEAVAIATQAAKSLVFTGAAATGLTAGVAGGVVTAANAVLSVPVSDKAVGANTAAIAGSTGVVAVVKPLDAIDQHAVEPFLNTLAYNIGQCTVNAITDSTILWIQGGFKGSPNYAINTGQLFGELSDTIAGNLSREILGFDVRGLALCDFTPTFKWDLANSVSQSSRRKLNLACPFGSGPLLNFTASGFYAAGDKAFRENGGWTGFQASLEDTGNPFGNRILAGEELAARKDSGKSIAEKKLSQGNGFLDIVDTSSCHWDSAGMTQSEFDAIDWSEDPKGKLLMQKIYCDTTTPGKIVSDQLTHSLNISMDRLGVADNLNKIITALVQQVLKGAVISIFQKDNLPPAQAPQIITYVGIDATNGSKVAAFKAGTINQFANDPLCTNPDTCAAFTLAGNSTATLTSIKLTETGTVNANADLSNVSIFYDTDGNFANGVIGQFGATLSSFTPTETATINSSLTLAPGVRYYFYVRFDAKSPATFPSAGQTVGFSILSNADVVVTGGAGTTGAPRYLQGTTVIQPLQ